MPPANPNATPTPGNPYANQVTGAVGIFTKNFLQTGNLLRSLAQVLLKCLSQLLIRRGLRHLR